MRAWQYNNFKSGIDDALRLNPAARVPKPTANQHLVQILATALNPVDYKPAETFLNRFISKPATPGIDYAGRLITPAAGSKLKPGQLVFGVAGTSAFAGGSLAEYAIVKSEGALAIPEGVDLTDAATIGVAGITAYQCIVPFVKPGSRVFLNGGSGGTGVFGIQIAKAKGCFVATACSTANVDLCRSLGADAVIDYKKQNVVDALAAMPQKFDHVVDNVGDFGIYFRAHEFTKPGAVFMEIAGSPTLSFFGNSLRARLQPRFLGGGQRQLKTMFAQMRINEFQELVDWMKEGKIKTVIDTRFAFEDAPKAFTKLKTGRANGKIVVDVAAQK